MTQWVSFVYTNYKGETTGRTVLPLRIYFGSNQWHPEPQWLLDAEDGARGEVRTFAVKDISGWKPSA